MGTMTREQFIEEFGITPEELVEEGRAFDACVRFLIERRDELRARYLERWIAIYEERVVADAATHEELLQRLDELGVPSGRSVIEFFPTEEPILILFESC